MCLPAVFSGQKRRSDFQPLDIMVRRPGKTIIHKNRNPDCNRDRAPHEDAVSPAPYAFSRRIVGTKMEYQDEKKAAFTSEMFARTMKE